MRKKLALSEIAPDDRFTEDVYIEGDNLLVPAGAPVKKKDLEALKRWNIEYVETEGERVVKKNEDSAGCEEFGYENFFGSKDLYRRYTELLDRLNQLFRLIGREQAVESKAFDLMAQGTLALVRDERNAASTIILGSGIVCPDEGRSALNSAILSVVIGMTLKLPPYRLLYLATGALLHDTGMLRLPESIVGKKGRLSGEELQKVRAHPLISYKIITKELLYPDEVGLVGLQHHERWDGEGYPRRTKGDEIELLARIVSVADAFEAMVSDKPYRSPMIGYAAIKALLSDNERRFDPEVLRAFIRSMGIYPLGSTVMLNNSAIARVVDINPDAPLRPSIRLIVDEFGRHFEDESGELLNLITEKGLFIARAIDSRDLREA